MLKTEVIGRQPLVVSLGESRDKDYSFLNIESMGETRKIPIFSVRNSNHQELIARNIVSGRIGVLEAGVIGVLIAVSNDSLNSNRIGRKFWEVKRGRGSSDKVPTMILPEHHPKVVDYGKIHSDFAFLKDPRKRHKFFDKYPLHVILPVIADANINKDVFVTTPEDSLRKPQDQWVSEPTVCIFFPGGDIAWKSIARLASQINPDVHLGVSSLNDHGEQPPYDLDELIGFVNDKQRVDFDFIIQDPIVRRAQIKSSHTQMRLPLRDETPEIRIIRDGSISPGTIKAHTGYPVKVLESCRFASHGHPQDDRLKGLDYRVFQYLSEANS